MAYKSFEENLSWQKANDLTIEIYKSFQNSKDYWFREQLLILASNAASTIAKGQDLPISEFIECLQEARDNFTKCRSMLSAVERLKIIKDSEILMLKEKLVDASKLSFGLLRKLKEKKAA